MKSIFAPLINMAKMKMKTVDRIYYMRHGHNINYLSLAYNGIAIENDNKQH